MSYDDELHEIATDDAAPKLRRSVFKYLEERARMLEDSELQDLLLNARHGDADAVRELVERYPRLEL